MGTNSNISSVQIVLIVLAFFVALIVVATVKKVFYKLRYKKRYYIFPRPSINGIAYIAMVVSLSVAVLLLLTVITANAFAVLFRAFPGTRITIEGILIKIGGLLFGPFTGIFIGLLTDILSVVMTAGIFHYGYFISAMAYGLLSGLIKTIVTYSSNNKFKFSIYSTIFLLVILVLSFLYFYSISYDHPIKLNFFIDLPEITFTIIISIFISFFSLTIGIIWLFYFISWRRQMLQKKLNPITFGQENNVNKIEYTKSGKRKRPKTDKFLTFCPAIVCVIANETIINTIMMPYFDADLSTLMFEDWFAIRILLFIPMVIFNMVFIYPVYSIVAPLIKYNYRDDFIDRTPSNLEIKKTGVINEKNR